MGKQILILGAGFGGLEAATNLREKLDDSYDITLIDKNDSFIIGFTKFDVMFGRRSAEQVKSYYRNLARSPAYCCLPLPLRFVIAQVPSRRSASACWMLTNRVLGSLPK